MKRIFKFLFYLPLFSPLIVHAISSGDVPDTGMVSGSTDIKTFLVNAINYILGFAGALAVLFVIIGGIMYITSSGNDDNIKRAKSVLTNAIIGTIIIALSIVIINLVVNVATKIT